jgi:hypothetical protein
MAGLCSFFGISLAVVCMAMPAHVKPRLWAALALLAVLLTLAGIPAIPQ